MRKSRRITLTAGSTRIIVFLALSATVFYASCKKKNDTPTPTGTSLNNKDTAYVDSIYLNNSVEIKFGKLAMQKATTTALKNYAATLVAQQTKIKSSLDSLNSKKNYKPRIPSDSLDSYHASLYSSLSSMSASWSWDSSYMAIYQLNEDYSMYDILIETSTKGSDSDLKSFALKNSAVIVTQVGSDTTIIQNNGF